MKVLHNRLKYDDLYDGMFVQTHYPEDNRMFKVSRNSKNLWYWSGVKFSVIEIGCNIGRTIPLYEESYTNELTNHGWWDTNQTRKLNRVDKLKYGILYKL